MGFIFLGLVGFAVFYAQQSHQNLKHVIMVGLTLFIVGWVIEISCLSRKAIALQKQSRGQGE